MNPIDTAVADDGAVLVECTLDAPPEKVWRALTIPELVADWLDAQPANTAVRGSAPHRYKIIDAEPFSRLRYRWLDDAKEHADSVVTFELRARDDGRTAFRLIHSRPAAMLLPANGNAPPVARAA